MGRGRNDEGEEADEEDEGAEDEAEEERTPEPNGGANTWKGDERGG